MGKRLMELTPDPPRRSFEEFRGYLTLLARLQITPLDDPLRFKLSSSDIVQETLLNAYQAGDQLRAKSDGETAAWLRRILTNALTDAVRRLSSDRRDVRREKSLSVRIEQSSARLEALLAIDSRSVSEREAREDQLRKLADALSRLPDDQRTAVEHLHLHGHSVAEISKQMDKTEAAVGGLLRRGVKKLRELLASEK
jgi:RNA polymerase sigma-70 factor (ECF subfamily)